MQAKALVAAWGILILLVGLILLGRSIEPTVTSAEEIVPMATPKQDLTPRPRFYKHLPEDFELPSDETGQLLLREYGAVFVAREGAVPPQKVIFRDEADVTRFQGSIKVGAKVIGGHTVELQKAALDSLTDAIDDARKARLSITPRGDDSARRDYDDTLRLWASRVNPGMKYWVAKGRLSPAEAKRIQGLSPFEQVPEILRLEQSGIFFAKSLDKSIIYSVAPPGTSQHLSMLAFDVAEFDNSRVRAILAKHGWFQTVASDLPHFTYIGVSEKDLPGLGLKQITDKTGRIFWVPDL
jgi:hypothetical protein